MAGLPLLLSFLAGATTCLGGAAACLLAGKFTPRSFASSLSFASGVMVFVSFIEIYFEGLEALAEGLEDTFPDNYDGAAACVAMALFFAGWFLANGMNCLAHLIIRGTDLPSKGAEEETNDLEVAQLPAPDSNDLPVATCRDEESMKSPSQGSTAHSIHHPRKPWYGRFFNHAMWRAFVGTEKVPEDMQAAVDAAFNRDCTRATRLGYFTAIVLTLHNFPEGIATFSGAAADIRVGVGLAIAIGIHNIPEGIAVAVPILYGTGSKCKAMLYATISGMAEPLGALIAWGLLGDDFSPMVMGVLFLLIAGIMVNVSVKELLFTALRYDPGNKVTSFSFVIGMVIMSVSLVALHLV